MNNWGSHNGQSHSIDKSIPKEQTRGLTSTQREVRKKRHKKKRRQKEKEYD